MPSVYVPIFEEFSYSSPLPRLLLRHLWLWLSPRQALLVLCCSGIVCPTIDVRVSMEPHSRATPSFFPSALLAAGQYAYSYCNKQPWIALSIVLHAVRRHDLAHVKLRWSIFLLSFNARTKLMEIHEATNLLSNFDPNKKFVSLVTNMHPCVPIQICTCIDLYVH